MGVINEGEVPGDVLASSREQRMIPKEVKGLDDPIPKCISILYFVLLRLQNFPK